MNYNAFSRWRRDDISWPVVAGLCSDLLLATFVLIFLALAAEERESSLLFFLVRFDVHAGELCSGHRLRAFRWLRRLSFQRRGHVSRGGCVELWRHAHRQGCRRRVRRSSLVIGRHRTIVSAVTSIVRRHSSLRRRHRPRL